MKKTVIVASALKALALLRQLNRQQGLNANALAAATGLSRGTAYRLLETLRGDGCVMRDERGLFWLTAGVMGFSTGYKQDAWIHEIAMPAMDALTRRILWPLSIAVPVGGSMMVHSTSDAASPLTRHRTWPGDRLPLAGSAAGRVYLAHLRPIERETLLALADNEGASTYDNAPGALSDAESRLIVEQGYEVVHQGRMVFALAVPIFRAGTADAALVLRAFSRSMSQRTLIGRYLGDLQDLAARLGRDCAV